MYHTTRVPYNSTTLPLYDTSKALALTLQPTAYSSTTGIIATNHITRVSVLQYDYRLQATVHYCCTTAASLQALQVCTGSPPRVPFPGPPAPASIQFQGTSGPPFPTTIPLGYPISGSRQTEHDLVCYTLGVAALPLYCSPRFPVGG